MITTRTVTSGLHVFTLTSFSLIDMERYIDRIGALDQTDREGIRVGVVNDLLVSLGKPSSSITKNGVKLLIPADREALYGILSDERMPLQAHGLLYELHRALMSLNGFDVKEPGAAGEIPAAGGLISTTSAAA